LFYKIYANGKQFGAIHKLKSDYFEELTKIDKNSVPSKINAE